jgi:predicted DNA binding protein
MSNAHINQGHIYFTDNVIKVKCISNKDSDNKQYLIDIGNIYTANTTTSHIFNNQHYETKSEGKYYFINERQTVLPAELFIPIDELREQQLNTILQ